MLHVHSQRREQMIDITREVRDALGASGISSGSVLVYCPHTTAGVTINEAADPNVPTDILAGLSRLIPEQGAWLHAEGNSDAHLKATLVGSSVLVPIVDGELALGTWQGIFLCEFDGPRHRSVIVTVNESRS